MAHQFANISAIGLCSSLGGFNDSCAAHRAGLNRFIAHEEIKTMQAGDEEPSPLTHAPAACNLACYQGVGKTVKMLELAFTDFQANFGQALQYENLQVLIALPDPEDRALEVDDMPDTPREARLQAYMDTVTGPLFSMICPELTTVPMQCVFGDRIAFARILKKSMDVLANNKASHCLLLIADSLVDDLMLEDQLENNLLKHGGNPVGYIPGEGAAVILLSASTDKASKAPGTLGVHVSVNLDNTALDEEDAEADREQWCGGKLASLITQHLTYSDSKEKVQFFPQQICDTNGEESRAIEMGMTQVKLKLVYPNTRFLEPHIPALGFGELGAMMGPIALATCAASVQRRYAMQRDFIITLSEDDGKRAVIQLHF